MLPLRDCVNRFYEGDSANYTTAPANARRQKRARNSLDANEGHLDDTDGHQPPGKLTDDDEPPRKRQPIQITTVEGDDKNEDGSADENEDTGTINEGADEADKDVVVDIADIQNKNNKMTAYAEELMRHKHTYCRRHQSAAYLQ
ncbi:hypothetical protein LTR10_007922 [Elasticomyces elasticus]|nr:hypothetical protein LTR10_007922 [Elasticomyces elasticus]KAK4970921.1 hypothetical protein LTR42_007898 [Elasticomyces elasticus]